MLYITIIAILIAGLYAFGLWYWLKRIKKTISIPATRVLLWIHALLLTLFCVSAFLYIEYAVSFRGMWTFRIIAWLFLLTGISTFIVGHKSQFNMLTKIYFFIFSTLPTLIGLFLLIPFLGIIATLSIFGQLSGTGDTLLYSDNKIRIQTTFLGVLGSPYLDIYEKNGLFEKRIYRSETGWFSIIDSVRTITDKSLMTIAVYHDKSDNTISPLIVKVRD